MSAVREERKVLAIRAVFAHTLNLDIRGAILRDDEAVHVACVNNSVGDGRGSQGEGRQ